MGIVVRPLLQCSYENDRSNQERDNRSVRLTGVILLAGEEGGILQGRGHVLQIESWMRELESATEKGTVTR